MVKVVKIGGNVVDNPQMLERFVKDFTALEGKKVLVHGGGVMASRIQEAMGMTPQMIQGRRVTGKDTLQVVTMVYAGWCNKNIVAMLQTAGCNSVGLCGADGNVIRASKRPPIEIDGEMVDFGFVGDVKPEGVNSSFINSLLSCGIVPVICAINHDGNGNLLNTNADTVASSVAVALSGNVVTECGGMSDELSHSPKVCACSREDVELIYCFEKDGVLADKDDESSVIECITPEKFGRMKQDGIIVGGMIPKIENALRSVGYGVKMVTIKHAANLLNRTGTSIVMSEDEFLKNI